ncbi:hypothetical protein IFM89_032091 [Coptis chinensis]|uniref:Reticulon-like protein n=1 Tax=Coptis chinensis TaxID=261450 RepID=A0A835M043_9MAGN|nr:hypothetical protein IFM89_032091 [Coptis chinensis]
MSTETDYEATDATQVTDDYNAPDFPQTTKGNNNIVRDIMLWRKKRVSASILAIATATWVALEVYQFNFLTIASWASMAIVVLLFFWGNLARLLGRQEPNVPDFIASEQTTLKTAHTLKGLLEDTLRWMVRKGVTSEWYEFVGIVAALYVLSKIGSWFDLLTLLYIGVVMGLTVPLIYEKYEDKIKGTWERMKVQCRRLHTKFDEKVLTKMKQKVGVVKKEKKTE